MEDFYNSFGLLIAGIFIAIGTITLITALKGSDRSDLFFSLMCSSLVCFLIFPPKGFILSDMVPSSWELLAKRGFVFIFYSLTPWFILHYTGFQKRRWAYLISGIYACCYLLFFFSTKINDNVVWPITAVVGFIAILVYGIAAARWQYRNGSKEKSIWLSTSLVFFGAFVSLVVVNQLNEILTGRDREMMILLPMNLPAVCFTLVMGLRLADVLIEKIKLELALRNREGRWQTFMFNAPFIVLEMNEKGDISFINNFGAKLLGYNDSTELLHVNWFDNFVPDSDKENYRSFYKEAFAGNQGNASFKNFIKTKKQKDLVVNWVSYLLREGDTQSLISIGTDITNEESANNLVFQLQQELEKEKIVLQEPSMTDMVDIIGTSKALQYTIVKAHQVANTVTPVLLEGETGVGKEVLANLIHKKSARSRLPFIKVNCGALPKELIEDELFGHEKGAFTSAIQSRKGRFELADGGTIFLDEIGELPLDMQPKLLRVLQNGEFERVGGQKTIKVDVRVIAATNRNLSTEVQLGHFRPDLYYRLNVFPITIPPLRKRKEDLPDLISYFIARKCKKHEKVLEHISKASLQQLMDYPWPGNIRELKNVIERSVITSEGKTLNLDWWQGESETADVYSLERIEKDHITSIMEKCRWKINGDNGAADMLAMHPNTLRSRMKKLGISRPFSRDANLRA